MLELIQPDWRAPGNIRAFTTTRNGGFSQDHWKGLNLGEHCGDNPKHVKQNRKLLRALLPSEPCWLKQVHGNRAVAWNANHESAEEADAIFSTQPGQVCAVLTADCLPVLFCNKAGTKVAAAHAGWRGLAGGVLGATISAMHCNPNNVMAWLGPAIGPTVFEVGQDVYDSFKRADEGNASAFNNHGKRWLADLYVLAKLELLRCGVERVSGGEFCVYSEQHRFYSYRRNSMTGRMASVIWLEK